jgi:hypothetical protein
MSSVTLDKLSESLRRLLESGCYVWEELDGRRILLYTRERVGTINGLSISIYSAEHNPPHFHVRSPEIDATFTLAECKLLRGEVDRKTRDLILYWYARRKDDLIAVWNRTRPSDGPTEAFIPQT